VSADGWVWGVDPSTKRVVVVAVKGTQWAWVETNIPPLMRGQSHPDRLPWVRDKTMIAATSMLLEHPPKLIVVEQPSGHFQNPPLLYTVGVVLLGLRDVSNAPILTEPPSHWKKRTLGKGKGNAKKPEIMAWAKECGYKGVTQDVADALGIAVANA